ncbi:hypothetical protein PSTT_16443 [Puccinia striiformis]|uniref:AB hydrolase-1 domain-containing protein n=1 Tax=Puccinia striiformis TaxID=27350 RepID=A0A2S4UCW9_9BASI|nr:hypothetical protein PSTT_16443 [Puccinia striiformis]
MNNGPLIISELCDFVVGLYTGIEEVYGSPTYRALGRPCPLLGSSRKLVFTTTYWLALLHPMEFLGCWSASCCLHFRQHYGHGRWAPSPDSRSQNRDSHAESIFQRRLLYMPYFPPGSRTQELDPADPMLRGLTVRKLSFAPVDGSPRLDGLLLTPSSLGSRPPEGLIYYLQGNAGNTLARLPKFRELLFPAAATDPPTLGLFALSPRGYWSSGGPLPFPLTALTPPGHRLSQRGLLRDYGRVLAELGQRSELKNVPVWLHGHSLGGAVAAQLLAEMCKAEGGTDHIAGLILENPLPSVPHMVKVLYPSKWLPYHYLGGFARDRWDSSQALHSIHHRIPLLVIQSEHDELVPPLLTRGLYDDACASRLSDPTNNPTHQPITQHAVIPHALHDSAFSKARYRLTVHRFISRTMPHKK